MKSVLTIVASAIVLSGCAGTYNPRYYIDEIEIVNNTREPVRDISVRANDRVFGCDNIAPLGICSNRFGRRSFEPGPIEVDWMLGNGARQSRSLTPGVPATFSTGLPLRGVVEFDPEGNIDARYEQESPVN